MISKAVIPAAGLGTRMLPQSKAVPKEMIPILDKPVLQYIVEEAYEAGIKDVLIITSRNKGIIEDHFDRSPELEDKLMEKNRNDDIVKLRKISDMVNIYYVRQKETRGLGHAVYCAESFVSSDDFAVLLGDDVIHCERKCALKQLMEVYDEKHKSIIGVQKVKDEDINKYGIIDIKEKTDGIMKLKGIVEKPDKEEAPSNYAVIGRYVFTNTIFPILKNTKAGKNNEIQLTDSIKELMFKEDVYALEFSGKRYDLGNKFGFLEANIDFGLRDENVREKLFSYMNGVLNEKI